MWCLVNVLDADGRQYDFSLSETTLDRTRHRYPGARWFISKNRSISEMFEISPTSRKRRRTVLTVMKTGRTIALRDIEREHVVIVERKMANALERGDPQTIATTELVETLAFHFSKPIDFVIAIIMTEGHRYAALVELCLHLWKKGSKLSDENDAEEACAYFQRRASSLLQKINSTNCTEEEYSRIARLAKHTYKTVPFIRYADSRSHEEAHKTIQAWAAFADTITKYDNLQTIFLGFTRLGIYLPSAYIHLAD